jgi:hypothetical protein
MMKGHLQHVVVLLALVAAATAPLVVATGSRGSWRQGDAAGNLVSCFAARHDLEVRPEDVVIARRELGLRPAPVYFLGRRRGERQRDLYFSHVVLSGQAIPVHASPLFALTESKLADEGELSLDPGGRFLAFASFLDGKASAVTVLDLEGLSRARDLQGFSTRESLQQLVSNWQESGVARGVGRIKVELPAPRPLRLAWHEGKLVIGGGATTVVDPHAAQVVRGPGQAARVKVARKNFVSWAVDTVRNLSFVGNERIAWLEELVFGAVDRARQATGAKVTEGEIKDEMDLPVFARSHGQIAGWPPPRLRPILGERMKGEGEWVEIEGPFIRTERGMPSYLAITYVRPDRERLYARLYLIAWDPRRLELRMEAGLRNPTSATGLRGPGAIPPRPAVLRRLVAAFNGGFQSTHGDFGMMVERKVYAPAKPWAATVARMRDGSTGFGTWDGAEPYGRHPEQIDSFRQNLTPLVEDGVFNPWKRGSWGGGTGYYKATGAKAQTWRSGLCLHQSGHVMYALGNPIDGPTMGKAMQRIGCSYGMELDINITHVGFDYIQALGPDEKDPPGAESFRPERMFSARGKWPGLPSFRYLMRVSIRGTSNMPFPRWTGRADDREFFYLLKRDALPGADLRPPGGQANEGRWTSAALPAAATSFPVAASRTVLAPDSRRPELRVHLVQLDLRWLEASLCVPAAGGDCLRPPGAAPLALLPVGAASASRLIVADGKALAEAPGAAGPYLNLRPLRGGGPALPVVAEQPVREPGSIAVGGAVEGTARAKHAAAVCARDDTLLYAAGLGAGRAELEAALRHAGCARAIHLGAAEPLVLVDKGGAESVFGKAVAPAARSASLVFRRGTAAWGHRIFTHVKPQPRRVWTQVQPEWTRNSVLKRSGAIAAAAGLPPVKRVEDLCRPPWSENAELRKLRWRDPITGEVCGAGYSPKIKIDPSLKKLLRGRPAPTDDADADPDSDAAAPKPKKRKRR